MTPRSSVLGFRVHSTFTLKGRRQRNKLHEERERKREREREREGRGRSSETKREQVEGKERKKKSMSGNVRRWRRTGRRGGSDGAVVSLFPSLTLVQQRRNF